MTNVPLGLKRCLAPLKLPAWRYYPLVDSTNDLALAWAQAGAADNSLVLADAQTAGRGREGRSWVTVPGAALAFSLIVRPTPQEVSCLARFTALPALGLAAALAEQGLEGKVKWPNDVLLHGKKVSGVLVEAVWQADQIVALVLGMGVNVATSSIPLDIPLRLPTTAVEKELGGAVDRWALLARILHHIQRYRQRLPDELFVAAWNDALAFKGQPIAYRDPAGKRQTATVQRVLSDGRLALRAPDGAAVTVVAGDIDTITPLESPDRAS